MATLIKSLVITLNIAWLLWAWWRLGRLDHRKLWRSCAAGWFALTTLHFLWLSYARSQPTHISIPTPTLGITYVWDLLILIPLTALILLGESTGLLINICHKLRQRKRPATPIPPRNTASISRREFLQTAAITAPPALAIAGGTFGYFQSRQFRIRRVDVDIPGLPPALDGITIAHLSDIHAGKFVDEQLLARIVNATNNLRANMILVTGDLIDYSLADLPNALDAVKRLDAPDGVYMCEGNHDLFQSRERFEQSVRAANVGLLINQAENLDLHGQNVQLMGLRWGLEKSSAQASHTDDAGAAIHLDGLRSQTDPDAVRIVLAHHPHAFDAAAQSGAALTLSGHTHGGQIMLTPTIGAGPLMYRYWSGLYKKGDSRLVVNNGAGNWLPLRINAPAEIIHLTLRRTA